MFNYPLVCSQQFEERNAVIPFFMPANNPIDNYLQEHSE